MSSLNVCLVCLTTLAVTTLVLLSKPESQLRNVAKAALKFMVALLLLLLTVSPIDVLPDALFPIGFADDVVYLMGVVASIKSGLREFKSRRQIEKE